MTKKMHSALKSAKRYATKQDFPFFTKGKTISGGAYFITLNPDTPALDYDANERIYDESRIDGFIDSTNKRFYDYFNNINKTVPCDIQIDDLLTRYKNRSKTDFNRLELDGHYFSLDYVKRLFDIIGSNGKKDIMCNVVYDERYGKYPLLFMHGKHGHAMLCPVRIPNKK